MKGSEQELESGADAHALIDSLEGAAAAVGFGSLLLLLGIVAGVVLLKELADEASRRERGPV